MKNYTYKELSEMNFDDITESMLDDIRKSSCVKSARKVGKKQFNERTGRFFKKVIVTAFDEDEEDQDAFGDEFEYYVDLGKKLYVAYGSNLDMEQMRFRCPDAEVFGTGVLKNYSLTFWGNARGNGVATVLPGADTDVPVALWEISAADEKNLDRYEGYPWLYRKENIKVAMSDGTECVGMIYLMNNGIGTLPGDHYYNVIARGY